MRSAQTTDELARDGHQAVREGAPAMSPAARAADPPVYIWQAGEKRLARVESIRGVASLALVSGHLYAAAEAADGPFGYVGNAVFGAASAIYVLLALTGYLLAWPFVRQHFGGGRRVDLRSYSLNRVLRLFPVYWAAIVLMLVLQEGLGTTEQWLLFIPLFQNFSREHIGTVNGPLWTVVVELHFYFTLPLLMLALARLSRGRAGVAAAAVALLFCASLALWITQVTLADDYAKLWRWNLPANFFFFASGILLAFFRLRLERRRPRWVDGPLGSSTVWVLASVPIWLVFFAELRLVPMISVAAFLMLGAAVLPLRPGPLVRWLDLKPLAIMGVASYSLYAWHFPVLEHLRAIEGFPQGLLAGYLTVIPACVAVALLSFRLIETPFLQLRRRWSPASAPIAPERQRTPVEVEAPARATG